VHEYDLIAEWYSGDRSRTIGVSEALALASRLPPQSRILDLGCGNGVPITDALLNGGYRVVGLDTSSGMLARFRINLPDGPVVRADCRACPFADGAFDAAVSWGMLFHLSQTDQAVAFANVYRLLKPGAPFLFTAAEIADADEHGITGTMNGVTFPYYAVPDYASVLGAHGFELLTVHDDPGVSTYYLARKSIRNYFRE
jgi:ubiquinone/menaquinone biosynthesis C-methylase UbiE